MTDHQLYLPTVIPQWGIFIGITLVIIGYVDKKEKWTYAGWATFIFTGIAALYFNLFGGFSPNPGETVDATTAHILTSGWLTAIGGILAVVTLLFQHFKLKRYPILAVMTLLYFAVIFFQYNSISRGTPDKSEIKKEQTK
jgi:VIT1/CCC1 family predicted Fe2+/Mn2+ transporter